MSDWQHFAHGADIGVRGRGATLAEAFAAAAVGLTAVVADPLRVSPSASSARWRTADSSSTSGSIH
jgi:SHS2 domain-containing protein